MATLDECHLSQCIQETLRPLEGRDPEITGIDLIAVMYVATDDGRQGGSMREMFGSPVGDGQQVLGVLDFHDIDQVRDFARTLPQTAAEQ